MTSPDALAVPASAKPLLSSVGFDDLAALFARETTIAFEVEGKQVAFKIRPLSEVDTSFARGIMEKVVAPKISVEEIDPITGRKVMVQRENYQDSDFIERHRQAEYQRNAFLLEKAIPALTLPGNTYAEKAAELCKRVPERMVVFLVNQIIRVSQGTVNVLDLANFSLSAT